MSYVLNIKRFMLCMAFLPCCLSAFGQTEYGKASFYSDKWRGRKTSSGERYNPDSLTAAHKTHPFGTYLRVTNESNGKSVIVKVNDRGPFVKGRVIDLSGKAAIDIAMVQAGIAKVKVEVVDGPVTQYVVDSVLPFRHLEGMLPPRTVMICDTEGNCGGRSPVWEYRPMVDADDQGRKRERRRWLLAKKREI